MVLDGKVPGEIIVKDRYYMRRCWTKNRKLKGKIGFGSNVGDESSTKVSNQSLVPVA